jgi:hypothetical protein
VNPLTLGGLRPGSAYWLLPHVEQLWWTPCLTREEGGTREHCWFLDSTHGSTLYCHVCRVGKPRVYVGPKERVVAIKAAQAAGDTRLAWALAFDNAPLLLPSRASLPWRPTYRDKADWLEWWKERAAICEYLGGMSRDDAERAANNLAGTWD